MPSKSPNYILKQKPNQFPAARLGDVAALRREAENTNTNDSDNGELDEKLQQLRHKFRNFESPGATGSQGPGGWSDC